MTTHAILNKTFKPFKSQYTIVIESKCAMYYCQNCSLMFHLFQQINKSSISECCYAELKRTMLYFIYNFKINFQFQILCRKCCLSSLDISFTVLLITYICCPFIHLKCYHETKCHYNILQIGLKQYVFMCQIQTVILTCRQGCTGLQTASVCAHCDGGVAQLVCQVPKFDPHCQATKSSETVGPLPHL